MANYRWLCICAAAGFAVAATHRVDAQGRRVNCVGELGNTRVEGDLDVAGPCTLTGTEVRGDVTLFAGGSLTAREARLRGNLDGNRADFVKLERSRVDGRVRLEGFVGDQSVIELTEVRGNVELTGNQSRFDLLNNTLGSDLQTNFNTGAQLISGT